MEEHKHDNLRLFKITYSKRYIQILPSISSFKTQILIDREQETIVYEKIDQIFFFDSETQVKHVSLILGVAETREGKFLLCADHVYCQPFLPPKNNSLYQIANIIYLSFDNKIHKDEVELLETLRKEIFSFSFYFSFERDLTLRNQLYFSHQNAQSIDRFFWNRQMLDAMMQNPVDEWRIPVIQGHYVKFQSYFNDTKINYHILTRRSKYRSGMRFYSRGIDEQGHCSNETETQQTLIVDTFLLSSVFISGSSPVFWEQRSQTTPIRLTRNKQLTKGPFLQYMNFLSNNYGNVMLVNLLQKKKQAQNLLINAYERIFCQCESQTQQFCRYYYYDISQALKINNNKSIFNAITKLDQIINHFSCFIFDLTEHKIKSKQEGIFRISCLDCLNRTNKFMECLGIQVVKFQMGVLGISEPSLLNNFLHSSEDDINPFIRNFKDAWMEKADYESLIYTGNRAYPNRKDKLLDQLDNSNISLHRLYNQKFIDRMKQEALDLILSHGRKSQCKSPSLNHKKYTSPFKISMVTWNVNATEPDKLSFEGIVQKCDGSDLIVIGVQEMMELHPNNVVISEEETKVSGIWEKHLSKVIAEKCKSNYIYIQKVQMVGLLMIIYINEKCKNSLKSVHKDTVKTGMGGQFGNKGGVTIRVSIEQTSICFVCAHLPAGESKVKERIDDFCTIHRKAFQQNKSGIQNQYQIEDSDHKFFLGDLNFRLKGQFKEFDDLIELSKNSLSFEKIGEKVMQELLGKDQLIELRKQSQTPYHLASYSEQPIRFPPTYKLEKTTGNYTTEKNRNPSWCDRILVWSDDLQNHTCECLEYTSLNEKGSDHRPVFGRWVVSVLKYEQKKKESTEGTEKSVQSKKIGDKLFLI